MKKILIGHTNISYKNDNFFYQEKIKNGFNHLTNYREFTTFNFVPQLIEDNEKYSIWEWINGDHLIKPSDTDLKEIAKILKTIHTSPIKIAKSTIKKRIEAYRKNLREKNIKIEILERLYRKINLILRKMDKSKPIHGDLWQYNILKTKENKIYLIDWEYAHMGDIHYELAYFIESYNLKPKQEKILLDAYKDYDEQILKKHKILVNYLTILWLYTQDKLPFLPDDCLKKLEQLTKDD